MQYFRIFLPEKYCRGLLFWQLLLRLTFFDVCWKFLPSIGLVVIFTRLASRRYLSLLGIEFKRRELLYAAFAFLGTWLAAYLLTPYLLGKASLQVRYVNLGWALMPISQAALEELVLRGLLLSGLSALMPKSIRQVATVSALLFMVWHLFFLPLHGRSLAFLHDARNTLPVRICIESPVSAHPNYCNSACAACGVESREV